MGNTLSSLQKYSYILSWSTASGVSLNKFVFLDYGGGAGILSLLAKELKIGTVIYNDIYPISCKDAKVIGELVGNQADYYVPGDIDTVIDFLRTNAIACNSVVSNNVIEHIYDIEGFLKKLCLLSDTSLNVVMASDGSIFNPLIRKSSTKKQLEAEYKDCQKEWGHKERDCLRAYLKVRQKMILNYSRDLTQEEVDRLARSTRGMIQADIKKSVDEYLKTGEFPREPVHPTNTCDPYTGNWEEHLMNPYHLKTVLSKVGFKARVLSGYYGHPKNVAKRMLANFLNLAIRIFRKQGIRIAPFFMIYGRKEAP